MKANLLNKKLVLKKETLINLQRQEMQEVNGGKEVVTGTRLTQYCSIQLTCPPCLVDITLTCYCVTIIC